MYLESVHVLSGMSQILVTYTWRSGSILVIAFLYSFDRFLICGLINIPKHTSFMLSRKKNVFLLWTAAVQL